MVMSQTFSQVQLIFQRDFTLHECLHEKRENKVVQVESNVFLASGKVEFELLGT